MLLLGLLLLLCDHSVFGQPAQDSPVFKSYKPPHRLPKIRPSDHLYQIWQTFLISRKANAGDILSQHELGVRYLLGIGVDADTVIAASWIRKAAEQNFTQARFNLAVLLYNGWGLPWDPFEAFRQLSYCANQEMADAQFFLSLFYLDNLVVPTSLDSARIWADRSARSGSEPARELLARIDEYLRETDHQGKSGKASERSRQPGSAVSGGSSHLQQMATPILVDFEPDSMNQGGTTSLLANALSEADPRLRQSLGLSKLLDDRTGTDSATIAAVESAANAGSPEALALVGRSLEQGWGVPRDRVRAAARYVRAIRMDSPRAPGLLYSLIQADGFISELKSRSGSGDPEALFAWAGLVALGFDGLLARKGAQVTTAQAIGFLEKAAAATSTPALIELGLLAYTGRWVKRDPQRALSLWQQAVARGSLEALVRLVVVRVVDESGARVNDADIQLLQQAAGEGSVLAEVALAYCHERGIGVPESLPEALRLYRSGYRRGSQDAYRALRRLHDEVRPADEEFRMDE